MGFRFTLENANTVANLTCGKIYSCYDSIFASDENYINFLYFLEYFPNNMYTDKTNYVYRQVKKFHYRLKIFDYEKIKNDLNNNNRNNLVLDELLQLSSILNRCHIKSLLLPSINYKRINYTSDFMTSPTTLNELLEWHPADSCLILQPQERISQNRVTIFDAFPNFDIALKQIDLWPAVLFWDNNQNFAFVPVSSKNELIDLYKMIHFEQTPIERLNEYANHHKKPSYYYFHLSDLHFGTKNTDITERRLKSLIKTQISSFDPADKIDFIITGDAVNSPSKANNLEYTDFTEFLESRSGKKPIFVLGNHDVNRLGLAFNRNNKILANAVGEYPKIEIEEDLKVVFLLFNSNTNGHLAESEIGSEQMSEMGNLIDNIPNASKYKFVAVLHHHVANIEKPDFYTDKWYEKMISQNFLENSLRLLDEDLFWEWLKQRNIKLVLHGHKHIPFVSVKDGIHIISCGSSTGQITHKDHRKTYLSYNVLKFTKDAVICSQFAEEVLGTGAKDINSIIIKM